MDHVAAEPHPYFSGERIDLVALEQNDLPLVIRWNNDERVNVFNGARFPVSAAEQQAWFDRTSGDRTKQKLIIRSREAGPVGMVSLFNIDVKHQSAEIGIYVDPEHQRRGYAADALRMVVRFAFMEMNLHKVYCSILAFNAASVRLFESVGFQPDGIRREHAFARGAFVDVLNYATFRGQTR
jgi:UDP-4-amino-4,6-dideoxy-N-acetyl-beta-L-altrosamine N-acetyltransferase